MHTTLKLDSRHLPRGANEGDAMFGNIHRSVRFAIKQTVDSLLPRYFAKYPPPGSPLPSRPHSNHDPDPRRLCTKNRHRSLPRRMFRERVSWAGERAPHLRRERYSRTRGTVESMVSYPNIRQRETLKRHTELQRAFDPNAHIRRCVVLRDTINWLSGVHCVLRSAFGGLLPMCVSVDPK